jgi:hypothetical protein
MMNAKNAQVNEDAIGRGLCGGVVSSTLSAVTGAVWMSSVLTNVKSSRAL